MDKEKIKRAIERANFIENNGKILRFLNMMAIKERTVSNLCIVMQDVSASDFKDSLLYLAEAGYIDIKHADGVACLESGPFDTPTPLTLTSAAIELLMGIKENPAVEV